MENSTDFHYMYIQFWTNWIIYSFLVVQFLFRSYRFLLS